jgi:hypothetical protein
MYGALPDDSRRAKRVDKREDGVSIGGGGGGGGAAVVMAVDAAG